ncbi:hypothetical protein GWI33_009672 [Rhynchophorus ferrugineus]|uniref:Mos1 transposase HTH domain-containing protein n=1 Tax=Rhynchophorus ferrugineus TaxID=354439 RepID=A0A834MEJ3_RHYFE|nr:hypothetical protein GWI33_009672 [Rhynchophorus ferrugineus]
MEKEQYRSVIRFFFLEGKSSRKIKERLDTVYGDSSHSRVIVKNWFNKFQCGRTSVFDDLRPGVLKTATTEDDMTKIHDLVLAGRRLKMCEIAKTVGISKDCVGHIPHEILGMKRRLERWVLRLTLFKRNSKEFLHLFATVDETWIH